MARFNEVNRLKNQLQLYREFIPVCPPEFIPELMRGIALIMQEIENLKTAQPHNDKRKKTHYFESKINIKCKLKLFQTLPAGS